MGRAPTPTNPWATFRPSEPLWLTLARLNSGINANRHHLGPLPFRPTTVTYFQRAQTQNQAGKAWSPHNDILPWCAAFVGAMLQDAGHQGSHSAGARSYELWGEAVPNTGNWANIPAGAVVVLQVTAANPEAGTASGYHVGFATGVSGDRISILGGNQGASHGKSEVSEVRFPKSQIRAVRWPRFFPLPAGFLSP